MRTNSVRASLGLRETSSRREVLHPQIFPDLTPSTQWASCPQKALQTNAVLYTQDDCDVWSMALSRLYILHMHIGTQVTVIVSVRYTGKKGCKRQATYYSEHSLDRESRAAPIVAQFGWTQSLLQVHIT